MLISSCSPQVLKLRMKLKWRLTLTPCGWRSQQLAMCAAPPWCSLRLRWLLPQSTKWWEGWLSWSQLSCQSFSWNASNTDTTGSAFVWSFLVCLSWVSFPFWQLQEIHQTQMVRLPSEFSCLFARSALSASNSLSRRKSLVITTWNPSTLWEPKVCGDVPTTSSCCPSCSLSNAPTNWTLNTSVHFVITVTLRTHLSLTIRWLRTVGFLD